MMNANAFSEGHPKARGNNEVPITAVHVDTSVSEHAHVSAEERPRRKRISSPLQLYNRLKKWFAQKKAKHTALAFCLLGIMFFAVCLSLFMWYVLFNILIDVGFLSRSHPVTGTKPAAYDVSLIERQNTMDFANSLSELSDWLYTIEKHSSAGKTDYMNRLVAFLAEKEKFGTSTQITAKLQKSMPMHYAPLPNKENMPRPPKRLYDRAYKLEQESGQPIESLALLCRRHERYRLSPQSGSLHFPFSLFSDSFLYYYPMRRWEKIAPYAEERAAPTVAWMTAAAAAVQAGSLEDVGPLPVYPFLSPQRQTDVKRAIAQPEVEVVPVSDKGYEKKTIFVSVAAFRDVECEPTMWNMLTTAKNAHRLHIGIAQQNLPYPREGAINVDNVFDPSSISPGMRVPIPCYSVANQRVDPSEGEEQAAQQSLWGTRPEQWAASSDEMREFGRGLCFLSDQIRLRRIRSTVSTGPTFGRYMAMLLYRGESLVLVIDSHNRFRPMFDALGEYLHAQYQDTRAVMSHYPEAYTPTVDLRKSATAYLCKSEFYAAGFVKFNGILISSSKHMAKNLKYNEGYVTAKPANPDFVLPQPFIAGGFLFANAVMLREVPFDPHLNNIFDGEEVLFATRLWTHGYNLYSPARNLAFHFYTREKAPKIWSDPVQARRFYGGQQVSLKRVTMLLRTHALNETALMTPPSYVDRVVTTDLERYGEGVVRTMDDWYTYAGVDPIRHTIEAKWC